jgi:hypothetical protein
MLFLFLVHLLITTHYSVPQGPKTHREASLVSSIHSRVLPSDSPMRSTPCVLDLDRSVFVVRINFILCMRTR